MRIKLSSISDFWTRKFNYNLMTEEMKRENLIIISTLELEEWRSAVIRKESNDGDSLKFHANLSTVSNPSEAKLYLCLVSCLKQHFNRTPHDLKMIFIRSFMWHKVSTSFISSIKFSLRAKFANDNFVDLP